MNNRISVALSISALVVALAVPVLAQQVRLHASVPFEFAIAGKTLPPGDYLIERGPSFVILKGLGVHASAMSVTTNAYVDGADPAAATKLIFDRVGDKYFLSQVLNGYESVGMQLPTSREEREMTKTSSAATPKKVTILASLR